MTERTWTYRATITMMHADALTSCDDCDWKGPASAADDIDVAHLTPGDPSPAGRCPECGTLAYLEEVSTDA